MGGGTDGGGGAGTDEARAARLRRLRMRAWRRGTKEMDLVLGPFADAALAGLDPAGLDAFEAVLAEDDHDLWLWVTGQATPPPGLAPMLAAIAAAARARHAPDPGAGAAAPAPEARGG